jgi:hypothetical protein
MMEKTGIHSTASLIELLLKHKSIPQLLTGISKLFSEEKIQLSLHMGKQAQVRLSRCLETSNKEMVMV